MNTFFSYFGSKFRVAKNYRKPQHPWVIEPFAGSAGFSVWHEHPNVVLCDADEKICGVWRYLIKASPDELLNLPDIGPGESCRGIGLIPEQEWLIGFWLTKGGTIPVVRGSMAKNRDNYLFWGPQIKARLAAQVPKIRNWRVIHGSYNSLKSTGPAHWFVDPPYQNMGKYYKHSNIDFQSLALWCKSLRGHVTVCEDASATWLPFKPLVTNKGARHGSTVEGVWEQDTP